VYLLTYVVMSAGAFACIIAMRRRGLAAEKISDLGGLARNDLPLAVLMAIFMFSMAGIPPMAGFFGKFLVFRAAVDANMWTLAIIGVLTSVVGCFYYLRVIKVMFFDNAEDAFDSRSGSLSFVAMATGIFTLAFFLFPAPFIGAAATAAKSLFE
jgi:NADH-quinone oxidoreductase subunit N